MTGRVVSHVFTRGQIVAARPDAGFAAAGQRVTVLDLLPGDRVRITYATRPGPLGNPAPTGASRVELIVPAANLIPITPGARATDPATAWKAARAQAERLRDSQRQVLDVHARHPHGLTDFALAERLGIKQTSCGKRRGELVEPGLIVRTDRTAPSDTGSDAIVWQITPLGLDVWRTITDAELAKIRPTPTEGAA